MGEEKKRTTTKALVTTREQYGKKRCNASLAQHGRLWRKNIQMVPA